MISSEMDPVAAFLGSMRIVGKYRAYDYETMECSHMICLDLS